MDALLATSKGILGLARACAEVSLRLTFFRVDQMPFTEVSSSLVMLQEGNEMRSIGETRDLLQQDGDATFRGGCVKMEVVSTPRNEGGALLVGPSQWGQAVPADAGRGFVHGPRTHEELSTNVDPRLHPSMVQALTHTLLTHPVDQSSLFLLRTNPARIAVYLVAPVSSTQNPNLKIQPQILNPKPYTIPEP